MDQKTYDIGMKMRRQVAGDEYVDKAMANIDDFNRDFQRIVTQYCWGEAWGDDTLKPRERSILNLGMIACLGRMEEFQTHVRGALNNGMTPDEIRAVLIQIAVYCGIPVGVDCFRHARPVIEAHQKKRSNARPVRPAQHEGPEAKGPRSTSRSTSPRSRRRDSWCASTGRSTRTPSCIRWCAGSSRATCRRTSGARSCSPTWSTAAAGNTTCRSWSARCRRRRASTPSAWASRWTRSAAPGSTRSAIRSRRCGSTPRRARRS